MRRTDRLFEMIQILRDGRLHRAADIATALGVTPRTVYRDMDTLMLSGIPVQGERGMGYRMATTISLPPLNLTGTELEALQLGLAVVRKTADRELQAGAKSLADKIESITPPSRQAPPEGWTHAVYPFSGARNGFEHMPVLRQAIRQKRKLWLVYRNAGGKVSQRIIRPLQLEYWGNVWTFPSWCEMRSGFRAFRIDQIENLELTSARFREENGKSLTDFQESFGP